MLSREEYVQLSLTYNLFWLRIMKEHAVFIEGTMPPPGKQLGAQADSFRRQFDRLLQSAIGLANGSIPEAALQSGQYYTRYTEEAERIVRKDTGIAVNSDLTRMEYNIQPLNQGIVPTPRKEQEVSALNQTILMQTNALVRFKTDVLNRRNACTLFTFMYNADLEHVLKEAQRYSAILSKLQSRDENVVEDYKKFWIQNMSDHAKVMRGQFDPTETKYFELANQFAQTFDAILQNGTPSDGDILEDTQAISRFKADATQGIIECKVKSIMLPLYTDHLLREANHFIYLMQS
ncbi:DUF2935 domain-containing protein [Caproiciproducens sp. NJN-50]|uniref:DUF2935 domain-containing protein n=1 Tax=Acutalibacteraceae TaxID=3082771 RepID=UPI000FFE1012|nr:MULTISPECIES: DUF2935 domain-containing protein [Acutalibacteraceae]QAT49615.1 DUF2935 domain-containing protein [Caproiciproducens sp. NJN-50]